MRWPLRRRPLMTRARTMTPLYGSNQLSKMSACSGLSASPSGDGSSVTTASRMSATLRPVLAETAMASSAGRPTVFSIISFVRAMSALGRSILLMNRDDFEAVADGEVGVGEGLRLDPLGGVDDQQRAFAGCERARDFIGEVNVAGRVDEVELVGDAVVRLVHHADGVRLDGDAALAFEVHGVEHLGLHFALSQGAGQLQQAVAQGAFAVVDVRDDREIADVLGFHAGSVFILQSLQDAGSGAGFVEWCLALAGEGCEQAGDDERGDEGKGDERVVHGRAAPLAFCNG